MSYLKQALAELRIELETEHAAVNISGRDVRYRVPAAELSRMGPFVIGVLSSDRVGRDNVRLTWGAGRHVLFVVAGPDRA